jgi:mono/diheme cytochrome c family protein
MVKPALGLIGIVVLTVFTASGAQQGCRDLTKSLTTFKYPQHRDMRTTVALPPQKVVTRAPDEASVPVGGRDLAGEDPPYDRNQHRKNPVPADDSSLARGGRTFARLCAPCHGKTLAGDGPVAANFMPPPDLLAEPTRQRLDGFLYSYIRFGGIVMPSYGAQLTAVEAWNVVNYLRDQQRRNPR